jgi:ribonuclease Z
MPEPVIAPSDITKVVMLGVGTPTPDPNRSGPSVAVVVNDEPYLFDAGTGVVRQAQAATPRYGGSIAGLTASKLRRVFLTHLHTDHTIGLPDLLFTPWSQGAHLPLHVHGPEGTAALGSHIQEAWRPDRQVRLSGLEPVSDQGWQLDVAEFAGAGRVYADANIAVDAVSVHHGSWPQAYGFVVETPDRVIVISGDNSRPELLLDAATGADLVIHEAYGVEHFGSTYEERGDLDLWTTYHKLFHSSTEQLAAMVEQARPGLLVLYHEMLWTGDRDANAKEIRARYDGPVVSARDLDVY